MTAQGAYILGCQGPILSSNEVAFFRAWNPWGFILFSRNIENPEQLTTLTAALREAVGWHAPILIDQEGGRVQRMCPPHWHQHLPALDMAEASTDLDRAMYLRGRLIAHELLGCGIDVNCGPLADIATPDTHPRLLNRCYGYDVEHVTRAGRALTNGHTAGGVLSVLKHIPGHGRSKLDTHFDLPVVTASAKDLHKTDFAPFKALNDLPLGMTGHLIFSAYDPAQPATTSPIMHRVIRDEIGFDGLLMTDDLSMEALSGSVADRSRAAMDAGCDLILHCNGALPEMQAVADIAGALSTAAMTRATRALAQRQTPDDVDITALHAELVALTT